MHCGSCLKKFSLMRSKKQCTECRDYYCKYCLVRKANKHLNCENCAVLTSRPLNRNQLFRLKTRDLQLYLQRRHISTKGCIEKEDLINLLLDFAKQDGSTHSSQDTSPQDYPNASSIFENVRSYLNGNEFINAASQFLSRDPSSHKRAYPAPSPAQSSSTKEPYRNIREINPFSQERPIDVSYRNILEINPFSQANNSQVIDSGGCFAETITSGQSQSNNLTAEFSLTSQSTDNTIYSTGSDNPSTNQTNTNSSPINHINTGNSPIIEISVDDKTNNEQASSMNPINNANSTINQIPIIHDLTNNQTNNNSADNNDQELSDWEFLNANDNGLSASTSNLTNNENFGQNIRVSTLLSVDSDSTHSLPNENTSRAANNFFASNFIGNNEKGEISLADIKNQEHLDFLTIKQLKIILVRNRADFKGCVEKAELKLRVQRLWKEYMQSREELEQLPLKDLCKICMDAPIECVILECGHLATCVNCGKQLSECPLCRQFVIRVVRTYKA